MALLIAVFSNGLLTAVSTYAAPGDNGTIKINGAELSEGQGNDPQLDSCVLNIAWFGFDTGTRTSNVVFSGQGSTDSSQIVSPVSPQTETFEGTGAGGSTLAYSNNYTLSFTGTGPYHVKVTITTDTANGNETKSKVFWMPSSCQASVSAGAITTHDVCGTENDYFIVPTTPNVAYHLQVGAGLPTLLTPGEMVQATAWNTAYTVTATPLNGYVLEGQAIQSFMFTDTPCRAVPTGTIGTSTCSVEGGSIAITYGNNASADVATTIMVTVDGTEVVNTNVAPGASGSFDATDLSEGEHSIVIYADGVIIASSTFAIDCVQDITVTPTPPAAFDRCYSNVDSVRIPKTEGVAYLINGVDASDEFVEYNGTAIVVTPIAKAGYVLTSNTPESWTFNATNFTNKNCITVTKTGMTPTDTNGDGVLSVGDLVTWTITVTNTSSEAIADWFYITASDPGTTLENNGLIGVLDAGKSASLTATKALTASDLAACKVSNTANYDVWFNYFEDGTPYNHLQNGTASALVNFTCPTPGSGSSTTTTATPVLVSTSLPAQLPATGPTSIRTPIMIILAGILAYGAAFFMQNRRNIQNSNF